MDAGLLRDIITIQTPTVIGRSPEGDDIIRWDDMASIYANIKPLDLKNQTYLLAQQLDTRVDAEINIRYMPGIEGKHRIKYGDKYFQISSVIDIDNRHRFIRIYAFTHEEKT